MKLGVNSVLFKPFSAMEAFKGIKQAGYDGVELSAIPGMNPHLRLTDSEATAQSICEIKAAQEETGLELLSMELATQDPALLRRAAKAAAELGVPIINVGPIGKTGEEGGVQMCIEAVRNSAAICKAYGVTLCMKAHVGAAVYNTPTTRELMDNIANDNFGVDMDPSHIIRAGENPAEALPQIAEGVKHIHIRDCKLPDPDAEPPVMPDGRPAPKGVIPPGPPAMQACGRGDIDLMGYFKALVDVAYDGPVCLEVIGPDQSYDAACAIASESFGYMNALLKVLGNR
ncbi:MAG: sugar phosphate isomerase/epimerase family protein [Christensenellales bacterium]|jgi:sugar phosphate isomerase/epimerase